MIVWQRVKKSIKLVGWARKGRNVSADHGMKWPSVFKPLISIVLHA